METKHSPSSVPPWVWVMEALTSSNKIEASRLIDMMRTVPDMSGDMGEKAREGISFRILESLLTNSLKTAKNVSSPPDYKISFEFSQRCEDVLCLILNENSGSKLKLSEIDISRYDIEPFLIHKCSGMRSSCLQQACVAQIKPIKDSIEGSHPLLAQLKEKSGLARSDKFEIVNPDDKDQEILASTALLYLSSGKRDNHCQRRSPDRNLPDGITIVQPPVYSQRIEMLEAKNNDNQQETPSTYDEGANDESGEISQKKSAHNRFLPDTPSANGDKADVASKDDHINDELTSIATKKRDFLSSQSPELNLCIKCNKNGCLLACSSASCPIIVHENCLPSAPTLYDGKFYCPFCLYTRAISMYMNMKEKALLARNIFMVFSGTEVPGSGPPTKNKKCGKNGNEKDKAKSVSIVSRDEIPNNRQLVIYVPQDDTKKCDGKLSGPENADKKENSEKESDESDESDFLVGSQTKENPNTRWSPYLGRRKKLPWTKVEEEKLKEGVERFSKVKENMPWKIILEFGCDVFHKGRTTVDLKDKWRNLQKKL